MESFVPFGGLFPTPSDIRSSISSSHQSEVSCQPSNVWREKDSNAVLNGGNHAAVIELYPSSLPSWLPSTESMKAKDDTTKRDTSTFSCNLASQVVRDRKEHAGNNRSNDTNTFSTGQMGTLLKADNMKISSKIGENSVISEDEPSGLVSSPAKSSSGSYNNGHTSPASMNSVTTDLGLGMSSSSKSRESEKPKGKKHLEVIQDISGSSSTNADAFSSSISSYPLKDHMQCNLKDPKMLYTALAERSGLPEASHVIMETIYGRQMNNNARNRGPSRGDTWFHFQGPNRLGKKKLAVSLAELLFGCPESLICADLSFQDEMVQADEHLNIKATNKYDIKVRGKTAVDFLVEKLSKRPLSVVFIEHVDKADPVVQNSLSRALKTGRFSDSHGREASISNAVLVTTSSFIGCGKTLGSMKMRTKFSEEDVLHAKGLPIQMLIGFDLNNDLMGHNPDPSDDWKVQCSNSIVMNKRKLIGGNETDCISSETTKRPHVLSNLDFDLNLPAEGNDSNDSCSGDCDCDHLSDNWLENFLKQIDNTVFFMPFDYDIYAEEILKDISECLYEIIGSECFLEIDSKVMEQILAALCLSDKKNVENWIRKVLARGFVEAHEKFSLNAVSVVKLVSCEDISPEEQTSRVLLPARIIVG